MKMLKFISIFFLALSVSAAHAQFKGGVAYDDMNDSETVASMKEHVRTLSAAHLEGRKAG